MDSGEREERLAALREEEEWLEGGYSFYPLLFPFNISFVLPFIGYVWHRDGRQELDKIVCRHSLYRSMIEPKKKKGYVWRIAGSGVATILFFFCFIIDCVRPI